jgi:hypothetical protein
MLNYAPSNHLLRTRKGFYTMRKFTFAFVLLALLAMALPVMAQDAPNTGSAEIRFVHVAQDVDVADIYVNEQLRSFGREVPYGTASGWIRVPAGETELAVVPTGRSYGRAVVGPVTLDIADGSRTTVYVYGAAFSVGVDATVTNPDDSVLAETGARVTVFHGIPGVGPVDIYASGTTLVQGRIGYPGDILLANGGTNDGEVTFDVPAGTYDLTVTPNGDPGTVLIELPDTTLEAGMKYLVVAAIIDGEPSVIVTASD